MGILWPRIRYIIRIAEIPDADTAIFLIAQIDYVHFLLPGTELLRHNYALVYLAVHLLNQFLRCARLQYLPIFHDSVLSGDILHI